MKYRARLAMETSIKITSLITCNESKRKFQSILDDEDPAGNNKAKKNIKDGMFWVDKLVKEFDVESSNSPVKKYTEGVVAFIEDQTKEKKTTPWKETFNNDKAKELLKSYISSNSLKSPYCNKKE